MLSRSVRASSTKLATQASRKNESANCFRLAGTPATFIFRTSSLKNKDMCSSKFLKDAQYSPKWPKNTWLTSTTYFYRQMGHILTSVKFKPLNRVRTAMITEKLFSHSNRTKQYHPIIFVWQLWAQSTTFKSCWTHSIAQNLTK